MKVDTTLSIVPAPNPINRNPIWAIALYAKSLFNLVWFIAPILPTIILVIPHHIMISCVFHPATHKNLYKNPRMEIFGKIAKYAVTNVGAPSYTSGTHIWNGAAPNLNINDTTTNITPISIPGAPSP